MSEVGQYMFFSILDNRNQAQYLKLVLCFKFKVTGIMKDVQESIFPIFKHASKNLHRSAPA